MSNPSFSNIDMWLFELAEGNLSPEQVEQLELFLFNNPDLDVERDVWSMAKVEKQVIAYPNVADLERKRRPVVAFAFAGLLLLLLGSGSYVAWNSQFDGFSSNDLTAQNEEIKSQLLEQIRNLQHSSSEENSSQALVEQNAFENLTKSKSDGSPLIVDNDISAQTAAIQYNSSGGTEIDRASNIDFNLNQNGATGNLGIASSQTLANLQTASNVTAQTILANQSVTNSENQGYTNELSEGLGNSNEVGEKEFFVRQPREIDVYEGRIWKERKSTSGANLLAISNGGRKSFKDRFNKFKRSLERMMNQPIALKNSRDPHYHVPGMTSNDINFSSAGTLVATRVQTMSRLQWQGQNNEQLMNQISVDGYSFGMRGGWGVQLDHNWYNNGGVQIGQAALTYSPKISVSNRISVEPSIRFKMGNKQLNSEQMANTDFVELDRGNAHEYYANGSVPMGRSLWYKDLGLGMLVNTKWFFAGLQVDNLFKYNDNLYDNNWSDPRRAQNHFTATIGSDWVSRNEKLSLSPYVVYQKNENLSEVWGGANFAFNWLNVGLALSSNLEPAASIGMKFDHFSLHYNADLTNSVMLDKKALSHQLTIRFVAKQNRFGKQLFKR